MTKLEFSREHARPIELFDAVAASNVHLASGGGEVHVYCLYFAPGGIIGEHPAGYAQLFLVMAGEGWAAGADGERVSLRPGEGAFFSPDERHSKGSALGMTVLMVQSERLDVNSTVIGPGPVQQVPVRPD
jgi:quercetin dioxygenase-like cupin family protein